MFLKTNQRGLQLAVFLFFGFFFLMPRISSAQITISGKISDQENGEDLFMANVYLQDYYTSATTNEYGFFSLTVPSKIKSPTVNIIFSYIGFKSDTITVSTDKSQRIDILLAPASVEIKEVQISAEATRNQEMVRSTQVGAIHMRVSELKDLPTIAGEKDVIKSMQLLPGIAGGTEGTSDFFVRGGDGDQNLVLLDEATVYNVGHLFGFFSVFNSDALKDVTVYKGGFPSYYGGRLSSIMDIKQKEGNQKGWEATGGIGLISSRLTVEGPLIKDKASVLLAGRRTYIDKVFSAVGSTLPYYFYDFNWKLNYKLNENNRIFYSGYLGDDVLDFSESSSGNEDEEENFDFNFGFNLGNITHTIRWNHIYNEKLFSNISFVTTSFNYDISGKIDSNNLLVRSKIRDYAVKAKYNYYRNERSTINFGGEIIQHAFRPNIISTSGEISEFLESKKGQVIDFQEVALFANDDYDVIEHILKVNYGLRFSSAITGDEFYTGLEPRISARYTLNEVSSIKASYSRMKQYMHRVSSSTVSLPTDLWYPVTGNIKPQTSNQVSTGYFLNLPKWKSLFSAEVFYKNMSNLIEYREGSNLLLNDEFEKDLVQGEGRAYGLELLLKKDQGKLRGWIGYTLSKSEREFDQLNGGKTFPAKYDRRHDFSIVASYDLSKRITVGSVWVYSSGAKFTAQVGQYFVPNLSLTGVERIPLYSDRNAVSMSPSHRLDLNFTIRPKRERERWHGEWQIGCYNLYNRATPFRIEIQTESKQTATGEEISQVYKQPGLFGFIPYFTYNFKFK